MERMRRAPVPGSELFKVLQMDDRSGVVFAKVESIEKVDIDGGSDDAVRRQQLAEVKVARGGSFRGQRRPVERDRPYAEVSIQGNLGVIKWPGRRTEIPKSSDVDSRRHIRGIRRIIDLVLDQRGHRRITNASRGVNQSLERERTRQPRIFQLFHLRDVGGGDATLPTPATRKQNKSSAKSQKLVVRSLRLGAFARSSIRKNI